MNKPLRILHLEDERDFSTLVSILLEREGLNARIVLATDFKGFIEALETDQFDLILADYMLPSCNGSQALEVAQQKCPGVPFVLLSGAIGEHAAIEFLRSGATDYVLKSSLERLVPAIQRAVQQPQEQPAPPPQTKAEPIETDEHYQSIFDGSPIPMWVSDLETCAFLEVNEAAILHYGYSRDKFLTMTTKDICAPEESSRFVKYITDVIGKRSEAEIRNAGLWQHRKRHGAVIDVEITSSIIPFKGREALLTMAKDITEMRQATETLKKSEANLAAALRIAHIGSWEMDLEELENLGNNPLRCSEETCRMLGLKPGHAPIAGESFFNAVHPKDRGRVKEALNQALRDREPYEIEHQIVLPDGEVRVVRQRAEFALDSNGKPIQIRGILMEPPGAKERKTKAPGKKKVVSRKKR